MPRLCSGASLNSTHRKFWAFVMPFLPLKQQSSEQQILSLSISVFRVYTPHHAENHSQVPCCSDILTREIMAPSPSNLCATSLPSLWSSQSCRCRVREVLKCLYEHSYQKLSRLSSSLFLLLNCRPVFSVCFFLFVQISKDLYPKHCSSCSVYIHVFILLTQHLNLFELQQ